MNAKFDFFFFFFFFFFFLGKGIFTARSFRKGEFLLEYRGDLLNYSEAKEKEKEYVEEDGSFMFYFKHKEKTKWYGPTCICE